MSVQENWKVGGPEWPSYVLVPAGIGMNPSQRFVPAESLIGRCYGQPVGGEASVPRRRSKKP